jgi:MEMO1 family protein
VPILDLTAPCPRLRPTVDLARVDADGQALICVYDRQDPGGSQVLISEPGLLLASLFDGQRTPSAIRAVFALRTGVAITEQQVVQFVRQLDGANLLDSERFRARLAESVAAFRAAPTRPAAHAGGAYPDDPLQLRRFLDSRYTAEGGPGAPPSAPRGPSLRGLIAPHIDLNRGGHSYAWGYRELAEREPAELYVVLGTCHLPMESPFAATAKPYDTPLGPVPADLDFLTRLARRMPLDLFADEYSHRAEHSIEFQALYLRYLGYAGGTAGPAIVPLLCVPPHDLADGATPRESSPFADALEVLRQTIAEDGRRICIVAGADFAHVGPQFGDPAPVDRRFSEHVEAGDRAMLDLVARGDADGFYHQIVHEAPGPGMAGDARAVGGPRRICGLAPIYATLCLLGPSDGRVLHYDQWIDQRGAGSVTFGCVAFP